MIEQMGFVPVVAENPNNKQPKLNPILAKQANFLGPNLSRKNPNGKADVLQNVQQRESSISITSYS